MNDRMMKVHDGEDKRKMIVCAKKRERGTRSVSG
jgi:hypothetical protein